MISDFMNPAPRETLIALAQRQIGAVFGDRCQFPAQTRRARSHRTLSLARPSTNLLDEVSGKRHSTHSTTAFPKAVADRLGPILAPF